MRTDDLNFELPSDLIAQAPAEQRDGSRLLHYRRGAKSIGHHSFSELPNLLGAGDLLVFNNAQVLPARFSLLKPGGGVVEGLFLAETPGKTWRVMLRNVGSTATPLRFAEAPDAQASVVRKVDDQYELRIASDLSTMELLQRVGRMPLPPYIKRAKGSDERDDADRLRYQTVYATVPGSVAAPTAGLHFTPEILSRLEGAGVQRCEVTLHVGAGTFKPVTSDTLAGHAMHSEHYFIDDAAAASLNAAKSQGRRIIAIGTTAARVLESQPGGEPFAARASETSILIYPPYKWRHVDGLLTNFHLPRSTLVALVAAMVGLEEQRRIYAAAIEARYRFFSYGDAMFVE